MLRQVLLAASRSELVRNAVQTAPVSRDVVRRFVAGRTLTAALAVARGLRADDLQVSLDYLGEDTTDREQATAMTETCVQVLAGLAEADLSGSVEVSLKLSALGQRLEIDGDRIATENAWRVCAAAAAAGTTVTLDMENHTTTDATLGTLAALRAVYPWVGAVLQSYLRRTEGDCRDLATPGSRIRLCKGAYDEPESVSFRDPREVDRSYARCLGILMRGQGYPMVATHDPRLIAITGELARRTGRNAGDFEYQMLFGVRPDAQRRMVADGATVRVYVPFGEQWYGYLMRRLAERPANLAFFARAVLTKH